MTDCKVTWVGHATVLVELDGVRLLTDPVLRSRVGALRRTEPVNARSLEGLDAVLISHVHWDHLDLPSLDRLGRDLQLVVPRGAGRLLERRRFRHVREIDAGSDLRIGDVTLAAVHAEHPARRGPFGTKAASLGFAVSGSQRVYFAGDTDLFDGMAGLAPLDLALLPVWGWGEKLGPGHLDPQRAAEALTFLAARVAVPIHWGTLRRIGARSPSRKPADEFARHAALVAPDVDVRILEPGEATVVARARRG
jgi:L-ascorbate metabolism protein UlaG (beta-lactamase superfamily)